MWEDDVRLSQALTGWRKRAAVTLLIVAILFLLLPVALLFAEPPTLLVTDTGYFLLTVDDSGRPVVQEFARVVKLGAGSTPVPTPNPPTDLPSLTAKAKGWAAAVPPSASKVLVQGAIRSSLEIIGQWKGTFRSIVEAEALLGQLLKASIPESSKADWLAFGKALQAELDARKTGATLAQYCDILNAIAKGLE